MKISIVVPVYNVEKYIRKCLESIECQTHSDFECILIDDGSTDSSGAVCNEFAAKDSRFRVIHKQNGGLVSARKAGVQAAMCHYICFVDSDDYIGPDYIKNFSDLIEAYGPDLIANNCIDTFVVETVFRFSADQNCGLYEDQKLADFKSRLVFDETEHGFNTGIFLPSLCLKCMRRDILVEQYDVCDESIMMGEDAMISFPLALNCQKVYIACFDGYFYRKNPDSIVQKFRPERFEMLRNLSAYLNRTMPSHQKQIAYYTLYRLYSEIISAGKASDNLLAFVNVIKSKFTNQEIKEIMKLQPPRLSLKSKMIIFLMKRNAWVLLYWIIKIFG